MKYRVRIKNPIIGVPITFLDKFNHNQFDIIGITNHGDMLGIPFINNCFAEINGKRNYCRILIKWKSEAMPTIDEDGVILYASEKEN